LLFDFIYSYHVIEHISDFEKAFQKINRVIKKCSLFYIGVPNKNRILGYIDGNSTLREKVSWNVEDYKARFRGKFENKFGAHAGFAIEELYGY